MARVPEWKKRNLKPIYYDNNHRNIKGFEDASGKYISKRKYQELIKKPLPGSHGYHTYKTSKPQTYYERYGIKKVGNHYETPDGKKLSAYQVRKLAPANANKYFKLQAFLRKNPGATARDYGKANWKDIPASERRTSEQMNKKLMSQRTRTINDREKYGLLSHEEAQQAREVVKRENKERKDLQRIYDRMLENPMQARKWMQKLEAKKKAYQKTLKWLDDHGYVPNDGDYTEGYYHSR